MYISVSPHRVKHLSYHTDSSPSCMYIHIHTYSVSPHRVNICFTTQMAQFYHTRETHNLDGDLSITIYIHAYVHTYTVCFTDNTSYYIYIYTLFRHTELSICFTVQIAHHHIYILYIDTVLPQRVNIVLPHRWPSFTTLGEMTTTTTMMMMMMMVMIMMMIIIIKWR